MESSTPGLFAGTTGLVLALLSCIIVAWGVGRLSSRLAPKAGFGPLTVQRLVTLIVFLALASLVISRA